MRNLGLITFNRAEKYCVIPLSVYFGDYTKNEAKPC